MKNLRISTLIPLLVLLLSSQANALPMAGDSVYMADDWVTPFTMVHEEDGEKISYASFCLESQKYFTPDTTYIVDSIGDWADGDQLSSDTKWLYAAYLSDVFSEVANAGIKVQKAIWYLENERGGSRWAWNKLRKYDFDDSGWNVVAVNIVSYDKDGTKIDNQSQLIGSAAPVPEPATVLLFGLGLFGLGSTMRRK